MSDARVRNAADREQVKQASRAIKQQRTQELSDLRTVLATPEGRRLLHRWITKLRPLERLWEASALLQYKAGWHDVGVMLITEIDEADPYAWPRMQQEARARELESMPNDAKDDGKDDKDEE